MRARILALLLSIALVAGAGLAAPASAGAATGVSATVFSLTNAHRANVGLRPLISDPALDRAAQAWANHLASTCTFSHSTSAWRAARTTAAGWSATGENIAAGYSTPNAVVSAWMKSTGHRANILNSRYTGLGVGYAKGTCYSGYWVQVFGWSKTAGTPGAGDADGDTDSDVLARNADGQLVLIRGTGTAKWQGTAVVGADWLPDDKLVSLGDFTGDGISDIGRARATGVFEMMSGNGKGGYAAPVGIGTIWPGYRHLVGGIDFNGDGRTDIVGVTPAGAIMLFRGTGKGKWSGEPTKIGAGWVNVSAAFYAGDLSGDTRGDIITRGADGRLWLNPTTGTGRWGTPKALGSGWNAMTALFSGGDFDGNGKPDVLARRSDGSLSLYSGNGRGGFGSVSLVARGWNIYNGFN